jgi:hypothetical protein
MYWDASTCDLCMKHIMYPSCDLSPPGMHQYYGIVLKHQCQLMQAVELYKFIAQYCNNIIILETCSMTSTFTPSPHLQYDVLSSNKYIITLSFTLYTVIFISYI